MKKKKGFSIGLLLFSIICFFVAHHSKEAVPGVAETIFSCALYPFLLFQYSLVHPVQELQQKWQQFGSLYEQFQVVQEERDALRAQLLALQAQYDWYEETEEVREFARNYEQQHAIIGRILLKQFTSNGHFFLVDAGSLGGVEKDTAVVYKNCLLGRVTDVYPYFCKVIVITDPRCKVAAYCSTTKTQGIYEGTASLTDGSLTHVDHLATLQEQDQLLSSGEGLIFPRGFGLGTIAAFSKPEGAMQYTVEVKPLVDLSSLAYCYILEKKFREQPSEEDSQRQLKLSYQKRVEQLLS